MTRKKIYNSESLMKNLEEHVNYILQNKKKFLGGNGYAKKTNEEMKYIKKLFYMSESHHLLMEKQHRKFAKEYRLHQAKLRDLIENNDVEDFIDFIERNYPNFK